ncbi:hypothetical protein DEA8626_00950 [Defluviimonas aquaemixtae]|uniref:DNA-binding protein n=1 Tax=Albidovulum aquaemixtae TaxID=1542388 RepID=A0A2R8B4B7_9RHOB|nr:HU family DNA-binding protein [Defluviimonas aquaemixtae]SPH17432.1 hypothetical protein DEA8626_00950 [Defluviimonas aquaemixtae]
MAPRNTTARRGATGNAKTATSSPPRRSAAKPRAAAKTGSAAKTASAAKAPTKAATAKASLTRASTTRSSANKASAKSAPSDAAKAPDAPSTPASLDRAVATAVATVAVLRKKELVERVAASTGAKKRDVKPIIEATLKILGNALASGEQLALPPLGKAKVNRQKDLPSGEMLMVKLRRPGPEQGGGTG